MHQDEFRGWLSCLGDLTEPRQGEALLALSGRSTFAGLQRHRRRSCGPTLYVPTPLSAPVSERSRDGTRQAEEDRRGNPVRTAARAVPCSSSP